MTKRNIVGEDMAWRMLSRPSRRDGKPLTTRRENDIRELPDLINRHCWSAAIDAGDAIRDLTAELDRARARIAELEALVPPICAHCGERNRDGSYSEHDNSWMCAPCHITAARGDQR